MICKVKRLKSLWHYEDNGYVFKKRRGPREQTSEAPHIENFVLQSQIHLLLQIA